MKPTATHVAEALGHTAIAPLIQRARWLESVTLALREAASDIAADLISRCELRGEILNIVTDNPAKAAKLRQKLPQFQRVLADSRTKITSIRVTHQPGLTTYPFQASQGGENVTSAREPSVDISGPTHLASELASFKPSSQLAQAAQRLLRTLSQRRR